MSRPLAFKSATALSLEELAAAFNASFAGYFYPQQLTGASFARRARLEQLDLQHSLVAYEGDALVGLALLGLRGAQGWCGGFGIVPEFRGRGCAKELMRAFIETAQRCGVKRLSLEVLARNTPARQLYERAGMRVVRDLLIMEREAAAPHAPQTESLREAEALVLLRHFAPLHLKAPAWQRDLPALLTTEGTRGYLLGRRAAPEAYALTVSWKEGLTHVIDLAAAGKEQADELCAGLSQLENTLRVVNEPEDGLFTKALLTHGFAEVDRQHEMVLELAS